MHKAPIRPKALLIMKECNPDGSYAARLGYRFFHTIARSTDVTLATQVRNRPTLESLENGHTIAYVPQSTWTARYRGLLDRIAGAGSTSCPPPSLLRYPAYVEFNRRVHALFKDAVSSGKFDIVHVMTPTRPRFPVRLAGACTTTPLLLGPVTRDAPLPRGFRETVRTDCPRFPDLHGLSRLVPGFVATYRRADRILAGSAYTRELLETSFPDRTQDISIFAEHGIPEAFFSGPRTAPPRGPVKLLFAGRLTPSNGADMVIEAMARLPLLDLRLTILGDGPERKHLEDLAEGWELEDKVLFMDRLPEEDTLPYYSNADLFCFPSVQEQEGTAVLKAMAAGLPCIVPDHGAIGELVTPSCGFRISPTSRQAVVHGTADAIDTMARTPQLWTRLSRGCVDRAREFLWDRKGEQIVRIYRELIERRKRVGT